MVKIETIEDFAKTVHDLAKSDRDVTVGCAGFTGEGKSVFLIQLQKAYAKTSNTKWNFNHLTWSRDELMQWIDGDKHGKGRMPEYSAVLPDELISMFYKRNWYEDPQKAAVEIFNKCRDRHLFIGGGIPDFWDLDSGFQSRIRFYVYIPRGRGRAWVFEQEDNPFTKDKWNSTENKKLFRKHKNPYKCPNFICEIRFPNLTKEEKAQYYRIRNTKRISTENQNKKERQERYGKIKKQRDLLIRYIFKINDKLTNQDVADIIENELSDDAIRLIRIGER